MTTDDVPDAGRKPRDDEMDFYGLTDRGKVRPTNEDHFLFCQLKKQMQILATSLPDAESISIGEERLAAFGMVADGVGGGAGGADASRLAVEALTRYVSESIHTYYTADTTHRDQFAEALRKSALKAHQHLLKQAEANPALQGMGYDAHACDRRLADALRGPGGRQPVLPAAGRRAHSNLPRPDGWTGVGRFRRDRRPG